MNAKRQGRPARPADGLVLSSLPTPGTSETQGRGVTGTHPWVRDAETALGEDAPWGGADRLGAPAAASRQGLAPGTRSARDPTRRWWVPGGRALPGPTARWSLGTGVRVGWDVPRSCDWPGPAVTKPPLPYEAGGRGGSVGGRGGPVSVSPAAPQPGSRGHRALRSPPQHAVHPRSQRAGTAFRPQAAAVRGCSGPARPRGLQRQRDGHGRCLAAHGHVHLVLARSSRHRARGYARGCGAAGAVA